MTSGWIRRNGGRSCCSRWSWARCKHSRKLDRHGHGVFTRRGDVWVLTASFVVKLNKTYDCLFAVFRSRFLFTGIITSCDVTFIWLKSLKNVTGKAFFLLKVYFNSNEMSMYMYMFIIFFNRLSSSCTTVSQYIHFLFVLLYLIVVFVFYFFNFRNYKK